MLARNMSPKSLKLVGLFAVELEADPRDACVNAGVAERRPLAGAGVCIRDAPTETGREEPGGGSNSPNANRVAIGCTDGGPSLW